jgi:hypothetical protein
MQLTKDRRVQLVKKDGNGEREKGIIWKIYKSTIVWKNYKIDNGYNGIMSEVTLENHILIIHIISGHLEFFKDL